MTGRAPRDGGFTLVEALVSLFVFSLIASGAVLLLMQSVNAQTRIQSAQSSLREIQSARALISADLAQFAPRATRDADGAVRPIFVGGDDDAALAFVRAGAEPDGQGRAQTSLAYVRYRIADGQLLRSATARLDFAQPADVGERVVLTEAGNPHFEFYDGGAWQNAWLIGPGGGTPPRSVALVFNSPRYGAMRIEALVGLGS